MEHWGKKAEEQEEQEEVEVFWKEVQVIKREKQLCYEGKILKKFVIGCCSFDQCMCSTLLKLKI